MGVLQRIKLISREHTSKGIKKLPVATIFQR